MTWRLAWLVVLGAACAGPAARLPGSVDPAPARVQADPLGDAIDWSAERRLTWGDFRGRPDLMSAAVALTVYLVSYDTACQGTTFDPRVVSRFLPRVSWVKSDHLMVRRSADTLLHEQTHFDLSEVQARRARQTLRTLAAPCTRNDKEFDALFEAFAQADAAVQRQYDVETAHGTNLRQQRVWESRVQDWLRTLPE